jgi:porin
VNGTEFGISGLAGYFIVGEAAGFAFYYGGFSRHLPGQTYELVLERTYAIAVARWLIVQPDLQYIINPGGRSSVGNAVVVGAQLAIEF